VPLPLLLLLPLPQPLLQSHHCVEVNCSTAAVLLL
jgi:hypothetical protein